jgi:hypothetical protein
MTLPNGHNPLHGKDDSSLLKMQVQLIVVGGVGKQIFTMHASRMSISIE